jgi:hypothetical protein
MMSEPVRPPEGQTLTQVAVQDTHPEYKNGHPLSATPLQWRPMPKSWHGWMWSTAPQPLSAMLKSWHGWIWKTPSPVRQPDGVAAAPVVDAGLPPEWTPQIAPSPARRPDEGGEGSEHMCSHEVSQVETPREGGNVRGTPLISYSLFLPFSLLYFHYIYC